VPDLRPAVAHARRFEVFDDDPLHEDTRKLIEGTLYSNGIVVSCWVTDIGSIAVFPGGLEHFSRVSLMPQGNQHPEHTQRTIRWLD
jgi:hypothetical protein